MDQHIINLVSSTFPRHLEPRPEKRGGEGKTLPRWWGGNVGNTNRKRMIALFHSFSCGKVWLRRYYTRQTRIDKLHPLDRFCERHGIEHKLIKPRTPRHNGKVERSHRNDNERFYKNLKFYSYKDLINQMKAYLRRSNNIPISTLKSRDGKRKWLTPREKRAELMLLDWGVVE